MKQRKLQVKPPGVGLPQMFRASDTRRPLFQDVILISGAILAGGHQAEVITGPTDRPSPQQTDGRCCLTDLDHLGPQITSFSSSPGSCLTFNHQN